MLKCSDCGLEVSTVVRCSHCNKWVCESCGWSNHEWLSLTNRAGKEEIKMNYPKPDYSNIYFNCYKDGDNPVIVFKGLQNGGKSLWKDVDADIEKALAWAQEATGQASQPYRGIVLTLPTFGGWRVFFGSRYITATRLNASCAGVRFERLVDVQRFRAAVSKVM